VKAHTIEKLTDRESTSNSYSDFFVRVRMFAPVADMRRKSWLDRTRQPMEFSGFEEHPLCKGSLPCDSRNRQQEEETSRPNSQQFDIALGPRSALRI
jgi:hypothetical protein